MSTELRYFGPVGVHLKKLMSWLEFSPRACSAKIGVRRGNLKRRWAILACSTAAIVRQHRVRDGKMCIYMIVLIFNAEAKRLSFSSPGDKMIKWQQYVLISKNLECWGQTACFILWPKVNMMHKMYLKAVSSDISSLGKQMIWLWGRSTAVHCLVVVEGKS